MDEVGRGALAGPVSVGVVVVDAATRSAPQGVRDSKLLSPAAREALVPRLRRWAVAFAVGHAGPDEIDGIGIIPALRLAGQRALRQLPCSPGCVLLDGAHDWLTERSEPVPGPEHPGQEELFATDGLAVRTRASRPVVRTMVKADLRCAAVAAASVLAKVERDALMVELAGRHPGYGWELNKGYAAPGHVEGLRLLGASPQHRRSWRLPGVDAGQCQAGGMLVVVDG